MTRRRSKSVKPGRPKLNEMQAKQADAKQIQEFIAALSHDLRQPLQTMGLLHGVLLAIVKDDEARKVVAGLEDALNSVRGSLDALLARHQTEAAATVSKKDYGPAQGNGRTNGAVEHAPNDVERTQAPVIFIIDDSREVREGMGYLLNSKGYNVELFETCEGFLVNFQPPREGCVIVDALLPGMSGIDFLKQLNARSERLPAIMITGGGDISLAVQAMKAGAADFIEKPINHKELLDVISSALQRTKLATFSSVDRDTARTRLARLSIREREIMNCILDGQPNKNIAADLKISQRTVEAHRANIMKKMGAKSLPALLRMILAAS